MASSTVVERGIDNAVQSLKYALQNAHSPADRKKLMAALEILAP